MTCQTGRQGKVYLYWLTPMGFVNLVRIVKPAHPSDSRALSAYQALECGVSRIRLACHHHPSATWLRGFGDLAQLHQAAWLLQRATAPRSAPRPGLISWTMLMQFADSANPQTPRNWDVPCRFRSSRQEAHVQLGPEALPLSYEKVLRMMINTGS